MGCRGTNRGQGGRKQSRSSKVSRAEVAWFVRVENEVGGRDHMFRQAGRQAGTQSRRNHKQQLRCRRTTQMRQQAGMSEHIQRVRRQANAYEHQQATRL